MTKESILNDVQTYIEVNFQENPDVFESIKTLLRFSTFIGDLLNEDVINELIKTLIENQKIQKHIEVIVTNILNNNDSKISLAIENVLKNQDILSLIDIYCNKNKIEIDLNIDYDFSNLDLDEAASMYIREIAKYPVLSKQKECILAMKADHGDTNARKELINCNLKLVVWVAKKFLDKGLDFEDLIQEGNLGLMKAVDKFNYRLGHKLATYATWWIRQSIQEALEKKKSVLRLPCHIQEEYENFLKVENELTLKLGRKPEEKELADALEVSIKKLRIIKTYPVSIASLNAQVGDDIESVEIIDFIKSDENTEDNCSKKILIEEIWQIVDMLNIPDLDKKIFCHRFGRYSLEGETLESLAKEVGYTHEGIRKIEKKTLKKIRHVLEIQDRFPEKWHNMLTCGKCILKKAVLEDNDEIDKVKFELIKLIRNYFQIYSELEITEAMKNMTLLEIKLLYKVLTDGYNNAEVKINSEIILSKFENKVMEMFNLTYDHIIKRKRVVLTIALHNLLNNVEQNVLGCPSKRGGV